MTDPYASTAKCVRRLLDVYRTHGCILVACDWDDTLAPFREPSDTHDRAHDLLRRCKRLGFKIMLFTAGAPVRYEGMLRQMNAWGFAADSVNANPIPLSCGNSGKPYYNILLDDKAGVGQAMDILEWTLDIIETERAVRS